MTRTRITGCAALLAAAILCGCARSPEARRDAFLEKGKALIQEKQYGRAILEFKNANKAMPQDAEPLTAEEIEIINKWIATGANLDAGKNAEAPLIAMALNACGGNQIKAADLLGLNRNTLRKKIRMHAIEIVKQSRRQG